MQPRRWGNILAGRDLQSRGTWLGVSRNGRLAPSPIFAVATRVAKMSVPVGTGDAVLAQPPQRRSVPAGSVNANAAYNPFNLLVFDGTTLMGLESPPRPHRALAAWLGVYPTPISTRLGPSCTACAPKRRPCLPCANMDAWHSQALQLLHDRTPAAAHELPQTGIAPALEHALSSIFITLPHYGTRASTVVTVGGTVRMTEQVHTPSAPTTERAEAFEPDEAPR